MRMKDTPLPPPPLRSSLFSPPFSQKSSSVFSHFFILSNPSYLPLLLFLLPFSCSNFLFLLHFSLPITLSLVYLLLPSSPFFFLPLSSYPSHHLSRCLPVSAVLQSLIKWQHGGWLGISSAVCGRRGRGSILTRIPPLTSHFFKALVKKRERKKKKKKPLQQAAAMTGHTDNVCVRVQVCLCVTVDDLGRTVMGLVSISALRVSAYQLLTVTLQRHVRLFICKELPLYLCIAEELQLCVCISAKCMHMYMYLYSGCFCEIPENFRQGYESQEI